MIRLEDITVAYDDRIILNHVNLDIHDGETLAVIGASGSGKSTTLRLIMGLQSRRAAGYTLTAKILRTIRKKRWMKFDAIWVWSFSIQLSSTL